MSDYIEGIHNMLRKANDDIIDQNRHKIVNVPTPSSGYVLNFWMLLILKLIKQRENMKSQFASKTSFHRKVCHIHR